jgi:hypothetical protein
LGAAPGSSCLRREEAEAGVRPGCRRLGRR